MASGFLFVVFLSGLLAAASGCEEKKDCPALCPPGWTQYKCKCYHFHHDTKSWIDAENHCLSIGGNLASIHSEEEHDFIRNYIKMVSNQDKTSWIGGTDAVKEDTWLWADGSKMDYTHWHANEPNNLQTKEHCMEMNFKTDWNDQKCGDKRSFVCSKHTAHTCCYDKSHQ